MSCNVAISTGHSEKDSGAIAINGITEYSLNVPLVENITLFKNKHIVWHSVDKKCEKYGYPKHLLCTVKQINKGNYDCCIEVHHNACNNPDVRGGMVIYWDTSIEGKKLAQCIDKQMDILTKRLVLTPREMWKAQKKYYHRDIATLRHLKRRLYYLKYTNCPAVIIEPGYISNVDDLILVQKQRLFIAHATWRGIQDWENQRRRKRRSPV